MYNILYSELDTHIPVDWKVSEMKTKSKLD